MTKKANISTLVSMCATIIIAVIANLYLAHHKILTIEFFIINVIYLLLILYLLGQSGIRLARLIREENGSDSWYYADKNAKSVTAKIQNSVILSILVGIGIYIIMTLGGTIFSHF